MFPICYLKIPIVPDCSNFYSARHLSVSLSVSRAVQWVRSEIRSAQKVLSFLQLITFPVKGSQLPTNI